MDIGLDEDGGGDTMKDKKQKRFEEIKKKKLEEMEQRKLARDRS